MADINWPGASGKVYAYWFVRQLAAESLKAEGGNYIFGRRLPNGNFLPIYVGETDNFRARLPSHERWKEAKKAGADRMRWLTSPLLGEVARKAEEKDLIQKWSPPLNVQHRKVV